MSELAVGDGVLDAVRRADWLFLLGARPRRAAYVGADDAVALGLDAAGVRCDRLSSASLGEAPAAEYDLVALHEPRAAMLAPAAQLVGPGGWLYVETHGLLGRGRARAAVGPRACRAALERLGLRTTAVWAWPSFRECREIAPLADGTALRQAFGRRRRLARVAALAVPLARSGLLERVAPFVAILAQRPRVEGRSG